MSQATCPNCGNRISCGCQRRTASDGKATCTNCLASYEKQLETQKQQIQQTTTIQKTTS